MRNHFRTLKAPSRSVKLRVALRRKQIKIKVPASGFLIFYSAARLLLLQQPENKRIAEG